MQKGNVEGIEMKLSNNQKANKFNDCLFGSCYTVQDTSWHATHSKQQVSYAQSDPTQQVHAYYSFVTCSSCVYKAFV